MAPGHIPTKADLAVRPSLSFLLLQAIWTALLLFYAFEGLALRWAAT